MQPVRCGLTTSESWNGNDDLLDSIDPAGTESITQYDSQDRPITSYGPAPSTCFTGDALSGSCPITPAESTTSYDTNLGVTGGDQGLNVIYYGNQNYAGLPVAYGMGIETDGEVNGSWPSGTSPATGVGSTDWSMVMTGTITFPSAGTYWLAVTADDSAQLYVDNTETAAVATAGTTGEGPVVVSAGRLTLPIRVNYAQLTGPASVSLNYATSSGGTLTLVPNTWLAPDYSLTTDTKTYDSSTVTGATVPSVLETATSYGLGRLV